MIVSRVFGVIKVIKLVVSEAVASESVVVAVAETESVGSDVGNRSDVSDMGDMGDRSDVGDWNDGVLVVEVLDPGGRAGGPWVVNLFRGHGTVDFWSLSDETGRGHGYGGQEEEEDLQETERERGATKAR
ncbi:hypothetical protein RUM43_010695 [Polyplax serrata]|uniref:Uncharacterized protein n=1 Tax=Polyplax serrata TaxID=468196 RepID=A0AAN8PW20_POLSC